MTINWTAILTTPTQLKKHETFNLPSLYPSLRSQPQAPQQTELSTIEENGCAKLNDITAAQLRRIAGFGFTHVWFTGLIEHATKTDYSAQGIQPDHPAVVKGRAGSPYAIKDYYDIDPDLAVDVQRRMAEFEALVERTHRAGLKMIIDFVPNHVARQYHSVRKPAGTVGLGDKDDTTKGFDPQNNFYYCPGSKLEPHIDVYGGELRPYEESPAKATGNDHFDPHPGQNDWYETVKLNYGVDYCGGRQSHFSPTPRTWRQMTDILLFGQARASTASAATWPRWRLPSFGPTPLPK